MNVVWPLLLRSVNKGNGASRLKQGNDHVNLIPADDIGRSGENYQ